MSESGVKSRVRNVLNYKKPAFWVSIAAVAAVAVLAVCLLTNPEISAISDGGIISARIDSAEIPKELYTKLAELIDSYGRSRWKTNTSPIRRSDGLFGEPDYTITLNMADGTAYTLKKYYTNAWSLFHGEYGYRYVLGFVENGEETRAWMMSEGFSCSREFGDWQNRLQKVLSATDNTADAAAVSAALESAIIEFMEDGWWYAGEKHPGTFKAASFVTLYEEETYGGRKYYGVSMYRSYNFTENNYSVAENFQISCVITLDKTTLACTDFWIPGDGAYFEMDIYNKFPAEIAENAALRYVEYHDRQAAECDEKARMFGGFEDAAPLLTVASGGTTAVPYENFLWSYVYSEDNSGWLCGDAMSVLYDLGAVPDRLPTVTLRDDFKITCAGNVTSHGVTVVAAESLEVLYRNADKTVLTALPEGTYYVVVIASKRGDYIEAGGDYESEGFECVFRLNVDEDS